MSARPPHALRVLHPRTGRLLAERLKVPRTLLGRGLGLMLRRSLGPGEGMWIAPCNGIHTCFMHFAIDAVFLDRQRHVLRVCDGLRPWRVVPFVPGAHSVLELPAGTIAALRLVRGEPLLIAPGGAVEPAAGP